MNKPFLVGDECKLPGKAVATSSAICLHALGAAFRHDVPYHILTIEAEGVASKPIKMPTKALALLFEVLGEYATGNGVTIVPIPNTMNTWAAARVLGIPRLQLLKVLDKGEIPAEGVGRMRRVHLADLIAWNDTRKERAEQTRRDLLERIGVKG
ncbi:hypothetical protein IIK97_004056 [Salmonella enterica subsp. enterica serovar Nigeria]|nr:hypothetical protein [Salmonella enterica subsp. enterica serovar Nigeria]